MKNNNIEMRVLIKGKPIAEYTHNGQLFVEGRHGSNFEIELINHNHFSVETIVSVDGLSVIDGKDAGPTSSGYVLKARETLRIPGWKLDAASVAAFEFAGKKASYAATGASGSVRNTGVIGILAYKEKVQARVYNGPFNGQFTLGGGLQTGAYGMSLGTLTAGGSTDSWSSTSLGGGSVTNTLSVNCVNTASCSSAPPKSAMMRARSIDPTHDDLLSVLVAALQSQIDSLQAMGANSASNTASGTLSNGITANAYTLSSQPVVQQTLGTAFGEQQDFATTTVTFARGDLLAMSVVYYDDARGLKARGIELERRRPRYDAGKPDAFPGMNCQPPAGWKG